TQFPPIGETPYFLTLGPHAFYWFELKSVAVVYQQTTGAKVPLQVTVQTSWTNVFSGKARLRLEDRLIGYIQGQRWFGGKGREIKSATFVETVPISFDSVKACLTQVQVEYTEEEPEIYVLPLSFGTAEQADEIRKSSPGAVIAEV